MAAKSRSARSYRGSRGYLLRREKARTHFVHGGEDVVVAEHTAARGEAHRGTLGLELPSGLCGRAGPWAVRLWRLRPDDLLQVAGCEVLPLDAPEEGHLARSGEGADSVEVATRDPAGRIRAGQLLHGGIKIEEREELGDFPLGLARLPHEVILGKVANIAEPSKSVREVKRVHVESLPVLDDLVKQHFILLG